MALLTPKSIEILAGDIPIAVIRKRIKHVHLRVHAPDGRVTISAPMSTRIQVVEAFVMTRLEWIKRQQRRLRVQPGEPIRRFTGGECHYVWGRRHTLAVVEREGPSRVALDDDRIVLFVRPGSTIMKRASVMQHWHKAIVNEILPQLIDQWEQRLNVRLTSYSLRRMKTRWGTCNYRARHIRLNTELATKPLDLLEYVLVHEMVHLLVPNHGQRFVALMNRHYPGWRVARTELNRHVVNTG